MDKITTDRLHGTAVGAAVGDALGMPLEFGPARRTTELIRDMKTGRLVSGSFTDDTEMALALAESLLESLPLSGDSLANHFVKWMNGNPPDVGVHTSSVLQLVRQGVPWEKASERVQRTHPDSAGNGSVMRCWPVAIAWWNQPQFLITDSILQSKVTHAHEECVAGSVFINLLIAYLVSGMEPNEAVNCALAAYPLPQGLENAVRMAQKQPRELLTNSGWVRDTVESAVWGLLTTSTFEEAVIQVANLGNDADTAAAVTGAVAGAAYGLSKIPPAWREKVHGEWPLRSGNIWHDSDLVRLADRLIAAHTL